MTGFPGNLRHSFAEHRNRPGERSCATRVRLMWGSLEADDGMVMDVEIELRIPSLMVGKDDGSDDEKIDNSLIRFKTVIQVPAFPPAGSTIQLSAGSDLAFVCTIARADWHEGKQLFVLACKYPKQRMLLQEYETLLNDPRWQRSQLPG